MSQPPTTIILVRHADVHNPGDVVYGRLPRFGLSRTGRTEAARTAEALRAVPIAALYSSPQLRARQTARTIAAPHSDLAVHVTELLAEVRTGWQGTPNAEMAARHFNFYDPPCGPDDERLPDLTGRIARWVELMRRRHVGQVVVGVSHGDPVMTARLFFAGEEPTLTTIRDQSRYPQKGSITRLIFAGNGVPQRLPVEIVLEDPNLEARTAHRAPSAGGADANAPWAARSAETRPAR